MDDSATASEGGNGEVKRISEKQAKRAKALARIKPPADGLCEWCHKLPDARGLQKHHKKRRSDGRDDKRSNLVWLCYPCANGPKGHKTECYEKPKPVNRPNELSGYHGLRPISKDQQVGKKEKHNA